MWRTTAKGVGKWGHELSTQIKLEIEIYWRDYALKSANRTHAAGEKRYVLSMFPYPSGNLHMGHVRVYSISDSIARFHRMSGANVVHPMGWDAFGLPAENAAIQRGIAPDRWTRDNISKMREQLVRLGCRFDWDREVNTCDPKYYKWTQCLFLELYRAGLVYKKGSFVNWDPVDQTVLADEQVDINGYSWRSGAKVEKKLLNQWFIKTTFFAKQLYDGLGELSALEWRDIIDMQKHWIGECTGITIDFNIVNRSDVSDCIDILPVWTDKPESLIYCKFIAVPSHSVLNKKHLISDGFNRLSVVAENPFTNKKLPIIVTDEIEYPEGAEGHLCCPEISETASELARRIGMVDGEVKSNISDADLYILRKTICEKAKVLGVGGYPTSSKLKDWLVSRQRYWGTPIPIVHCDHCGEQPVPVERLPVVLPKIETAECKRLSLKHFDEWIRTDCPSCGKIARRETDTLDTFVDSSWYFLRYLDSENEKLPFSTEKAWENMPVDVYIGGKEHATLHLYYSRFMNHFLHSIGKVPQREPFKSILVQGMVMGQSFKVKEDGRYVTREEVNVVNEEKGIAFTKDRNLPVEIAWEKMSKSKFNGVDPLDMFDEFGCDTTRLIILGNISPMSNRHWSRDLFPGILNWQTRIWNTVNDYIASRSKIPDINDQESIVNSDKFKKSESDLKESRNYFVVTILFNFKYSYQLSVAISRMQGLINTLHRVPKEFIPYSKQFERLLAEQIVMLAPMAPHFASELWAGMAAARNKIDDSPFDWSKNVLEQSWPKVDVDYELGLQGYVDGADVCRIPMLPNVLNNLTHNEALNLVMKEKKAIRRTKSGVGNSEFVIYTDCRATLKITTNRELEKLESVKAVAESN